MWSQYLGRTARLDSSHFVHEVQIHDQHGELQWIWALVDCSTTSMVKSPPLLNRLGLPCDAAHITTHGLEGQMMVHAHEGCKTVDDGPVYGSFSPSPWTGGAGCPNEGILSSARITMVQNPEAGGRLGNPLINFIQNPWWLIGGTQIRHVSAVVLWSR